MVSDCASIARAAALLQHPLPTFTAAVGDGLGRLVRLAGIGGQVGHFKSVDK